MKINKIKIFESSVFSDKSTEDRVNDFISNNNIIIKDIQLSTSSSSNGTKGITIMIWYNIEG